MAKGQKYRRVNLLKRKKREMLHLALLFSAAPYVTIQNLSNGVIDVEKIPLTDPHGSTDLLGDNDASEVVDPTHNTGCFHIIIPFRFHGMMAQSAS